MTTSNSIEHELDTLILRLEQNYMNAKTTKMFIEILQQRGKLSDILETEDPKKLIYLNEQILITEEHLKDYDTQIKNEVKNINELEENYTIKLREYEIEKQQNRKLVNELKFFGFEEEIQSVSAATKTFLEYLIKEGELEKEKYTQDIFISELKKKNEDLNILNTELEMELKNVREKKHKINDEVQNRGFTKPIRHIKSLLNYFKSIWGIEITGVYKIVDGFVLSVSFNNLSCKFIFKNNKFVDIEMPNQSLNKKTHNFDLLVKNCRNADLPEVLLYFLSMSSTLS
ncbi:hypothetical protein CDIK_0547 [Cucumispora dikerogammari]|nr:hypothetical protein CDIK_0547 [Cucumispora dikerogammari]